MDDHQNQEVHEVSDDKQDGEVAVDVGEAGAEGSPCKQRKLSLPECEGIRLEFKNIVVEVTPKAEPKKGLPCVKIAQMIKDHREKKTIPKKRILHEVSGAIEPGTLVAVMGKSTLLNVLSRRITSHGGEVTYNGRQCDEHFTRISAFVQQEDMFFGNLTVREQLMYQARLRLPSHIPLDKKEQKVDKVIALLNLAKAQHHFIGNVQAGHGRGISGGERKRLAFGTEVLTNPSVLFADEPTSGLDAFMAQSVVETMKYLARAGRTVIATIHQPSSEIYAMFDKVMYMAEGKIVYYGELEGAVTYFSRLGYQCPQFSNPADYIIRVLAVRSDDTVKMAEIDNMAKQWKEKGETFNAEWVKTHVKDEEDFACEQGDPATDNAAINIKGHFAVSWPMQFMVLLNREMKMTSRDPVLTVARLGQTLILGLLVGLIFYQLGDGQRSVQDKNGGIFFIVTNQSIMGIFGVLQVFPMERPIAMREHESGSYSTTAYFLCKILSNIPFQIIFPALFCSISYWMMGLNPDGVTFILSVLIIILTANAAISLGYLVSTACTSVAVALALGPLIAMPLMLFGGFFVNTDTIGPGWVWLEYLSFFKYGFSAFATVVWTFPENQAIECGGTDCRFRDGNDVLKFLAVRKDDLWERDVPVLAAMVVGFNLIALIFFWYQGRKKQNE
ncbi:unnamed protein product [Vitrella brassicaformis CCMP3155]|uniref:ABC transporter domain-containing protein n=1 Tax=Vitrella brassicaformis (strain CCMP3155) TaxID=1169540 RepID=A0A0G4EMB8_VITBC|nr:unnamed protein product [Vitrella brassicaformis CCMP3155]|eukprot:CEL98098.1 unnamed protein product [Vitrella brassicaformis CCMP3155]